VGHVTLFLLTVPPPPQKTKYQKSNKYEVTQFYSTVSCITSPYYSAYHSHHYNIFKQISVSWLLHIRHECWLASYDTI